MNKIDITVEDDKHFALIALLVDQPEFLREVTSIRKKYKLSVPFEIIITGERDTLYDHFIKLAGYKTEQFYRLEKESDPLRGLDMSTLTPNANNDDLFKKYQKIESAVDKIQDTFYEDLRKLRMTFHYPRIFQYVVKLAVLGDKVSSFTTASAFTEEYPYYPSQTADILADREIIMGIELMPYATKKDVFVAFSEFQKRLKENPLGETSIYDKLRKDTIKNIKRDREWYWRVKKDGNYKDLIDDWNKRENVHEYLTYHKRTQRCDLCYIDDYNYLHHAVSEYRKLLKLFSPEV